MRMILPTVRARRDVDRALRDFFTDYRSADFRRFVITLCRFYGVKQPKVEIAFNCEGRRVGQANTTSDGTAPESLSGQGFLSFLWPQCFLTPNYYTVDVFVSDGGSMADLFVWRNCLGFRVLAPSGFRMASGEPGFLKIPGQWSFG